MTNLRELDGSNVWQMIYLHLEKEGFEVYPPAAFEGEVNREYLVLVKGTSVGHKSGVSTMVDYYRIICYVPANKYHRLDSLVLEVEKAMQKLHPLIYPAKDKTPSYYDDLNKSHNVSITYKNYKKML